jgi:cephalosporin-C deacetylase-like acetyl esterase
MKNPIYIILTFLIAFCSCDSPKSELSELEVKTKKMKEDVVFTTSDRIKIQGTYYYNNLDLSAKQPLVILIHQFMSDRSQWKDDFIDSLLAKKYKVITYDIRNHGESGKAVDNIDDILKDKGNAVLDLKAVFDWAKTRNGIDSTRIGVIGTSIGASLGMYSKYDLGSKTVICVSIGKSTFEAFTGISELKMGIIVKRVSSVLFICGDKDGACPEDAKYIYTNFIEDPKELKYYNSEKHGKDLITTQNPEINAFMLDWLKKNL